jgi:hypothetical protein
MSTSYFISWKIWASLEKTRVISYCSNWTHKYQQSLYHCTCREMSIRNSYISHADGRNDCYTIHFWRYRGRRLSFSCFVLPNSFSAVPRASGLFFKFCAPWLIFDGTYGVVSRFHVLHARTHFRRHRGRRVLFSMFCTPGLVFGGTKVSLSLMFLMIHGRLWWRLPLEDKSAHRPGWVRRRVLGIW